METFRMRAILTVLIVLFWTGTAWADWIAVMEATSEGRLAKYATFGTQADAQAHVDRFQAHAPVTYEGDGTTVSFNIPFPIKEESDVTVSISTGGDREVHIFPETQTVDVPSILVKTTEMVDGEEVVTTEETNILQPGETLTIERALPVYSDAFVHERIQGELEHWKVDIVNETLTFEPDSTELDKDVRKDIESHARGLISDFMDNMDFETGAALHLLFIRANGGTWTQAEQNFADGLAVKFEYIRDVYVTAKNAIQNIPNMTQQEKLDFNASTDVSWPVVP